MQKELSAVTLALTLVFSVTIVNFGDAFAVLPGEMIPKKSDKIVKPKKVDPIKTKQIPPPKLPDTPKKIPKPLPLPKVPTKIPKTPDESKTTPSNEKSRTPAKVPIESTIVKRLQLGVKVSDTKDAGTDDRVYVILNEERGYLDYDRDDFEKGSYFKYDVPVSDVITLADIKKLQLKKTGGNGVGVKRVELYVNGVEIYERTHDSTGDCGCWFITDEQFFKETGGSLRNNPKWQEFVDSPPDRIIERSVLESIIEAQFGDFLAEQHKDYKWKSAPTVKQKDRERISVTAKFIDKNKYLGSDRLSKDSDVNISYNMRFECIDDGNIRVSVEDLKVTKTRTIPAKNIIAAGVGIGVSLAGGGPLASSAANAGTKIALEQGDRLLSAHAGGTSGVSESVSFNMPASFDPCYVRVDSDGSLLLVDPRS